MSGKESDWEGKVEAERKGELRRVSFRDKVEGKASEKK